MVMNQIRTLGHAFGVAAVDGDQTSPYAAVIQRRLVFDALLAVEGRWKALAGRLGAGWENVLRTYSTRENKPGTAFTYDQGPLFFLSLGASFSVEDL
jgi:hypothetical protein